jgi:hypothetical protein
LPLPLPPSTIGGSYRQNPIANYDQKGGNYMFLHTYTFTIDIVPLVLEAHYFAGIILEYKGIIVKYAINQVQSKEMRRRPSKYQIWANH